MIAWPRRDSVVDLIGRYDVFLIDQFGTLRDGARLYPHVVPALLRLRAGGARTVLLSNSGKRAAANAARLAQDGVPEDAYDLFVTSGEVAWRLLHEDRVPAARGATRCLLLERDGDGALLHGLGLRPVLDPAGADLVVIAGSEGDRRTLADYTALLRPAARAGVPALCLNPDRTMLTPSGPAFGAGRIGELYERLGGEVTWIGKPHSAIYDFTLGTLGPVDRERVVGIGDSLEHDIAGAQSAGCQGWLVLTGIVQNADEATLRAEADRVGAEPDGLLRAFAASPDRA